MGKKWLRLKIVHRVNNGSDLKKSLGKKMVQIKVVHHEKNGCNLKIVFKNG
jgi:hypothetical protein